MTTGATPLNAAITRAPAGAGVISVPVSPAFVVSPGQTLAARVLAVMEGQVELALAGHRVTARTDLPLPVGATVSLIVGDGDPEQVALRLAPGGSQATPVPSPTVAFEEAGLPPQAARALLAALAEAGAEPATPLAARQLAMRAAQALVRTPAEAAAFARLEAAGLPTTQAAVRGLASLIDGAPIGRALQTLLGDARALAPPSGPATVPQASPGAPPASPGPQPAAPSPSGGGSTPPDGPVANWPTPALPSGQSAPDAGATLSRTGRGAPALPMPYGPPAGGAPTPTGAPGAPGEGFAGAATPRPALAASVTGPVATLSRLAEIVSNGATSGDPAALRSALAALGHGIEAELAAGGVPDKETVRAQLHRLVSEAGPELALARTADRLADAIVAQTLAGPTLPGSDPRAQGTPGQGVYLQLPLPGGQSAEVRVNPDGQGEGQDGEARARRIAFLLHLSALGPVLIEALHGPTGTEAIVRVSSAPARAYLAERSRELADALTRDRSSARSVRVAVERFSGPPPARLLPPPPSSGLDSLA